MSITNYSNQNDDSSNKYLIRNSVKQYKLFFFRREIDMNSSSDISEIILKNIIVDFVLYWPGWLFLKIITWGKYPKKLSPILDIWTPIFGAVFLILIAAIYGYLTGNLHIS